MGVASHIPRVLLAAAAAAALTLGAPRGAASLLDALAATAAAFGAPAPAADERAPRDVRRPLPAYDFVVVGAGTAGAAVAARLAAAANWTVLLLEAGGDENVISDVPLLASYMARSAIDWNFPTVASPDFCRALEGGRCSWHAGRVLGGTTVLNYMVYSRGSPLDYDAWEALGNPSWGWKDVLPYFLRSEGARPPDLAASPFHGTKGPVTVDYGWRSPLGPVFLRAAREAGYPLRDPHGPEQLGFSFVQATVRRGARCSASKAYLRPLRDRRNLHVSKHSQVVRVVVDAAARRATGVRFRRRRQGGQELGEEQQVVARREVILCAGAMGSPKLLMLSGIGPAEHLKELGIPVVQDLRVGDNLQDHVALGGLSFGVAAPVTVVESRLLLNLSMSLEYVLRGRGALTLPGGAEVLGFLKLPPRQPKLRRATAGAASSEESLVASASGREDEEEEQEEEEEEDAANEAESAEEATSLGNAHPAAGPGAGPLAAEGRADVEVVLGPGALSGDTRGSLRRALGLRADYADRLLRELRGRDAFAAVPIVLRPRSRGRLRLRSADPAHPPLIYPNYLSHPDDVRAIAHGAKEAVRLSRTGALRELGARLNPVPYPECEHLPVGEDAYWECAVRQFTISMQHQVGTCKMGPASDPTAVVDAELRVHGVGGLRVADASIMPLIPSGHTMAPAYMIGEKAADLLTKRWAPDARSTSHRRR